MDKLNQDLPSDRELQENLRIQNQLLELKLQAEFGAEMHHFGNTPPEVTNTFLKNILKLEQKFAEARPQSVLQVIGNRIFPPVTDLDDADIQSILTEVENILRDHRIQVNYLGEYGAATKYQFITEELVHQEIYMVDIPGMTINFVYEEFHPDHCSDLRKRSAEVLSAWFDHDLHEHNWPLAPEIILPEGGVLNRSQAIRKLKNMFEYFSCFKDITYSIDHISYDVDSTTQIGNGKVDGQLSYRAVDRDGGSMLYSGDFSFTYQYKSAWWEVVYFRVPGFEF